MPRKPLVLPVQALDEEGAATTDSLAAVFDLSSHEQEKLATRLRREKYEQLCVVSLVPRFGIFDDQNVWDREKKRIRTPGQFNSDDRVVADFGYAGNGSPIAPFTLLVREPGTVRVAAIVVAPGDDREFVDVKLPDVDGTALAANTWSPSTVKPTPLDEYEPPWEWLEHQAWLIGDGVELKWWLDWQGFKLQKPGAYSPLVPCLVGFQGNGKDLLMGVLRMVAGAHNLTEISMSQMGLPYEDFLRFSFVYCPEMTFGGPHGDDLYGRVKRWTSASTGWRSLNIKSTATMQAIVQPTFLFTSNADDFLEHVPRSDRRLCVVGCNGLPGPIGVGSPDYFTKLAPLYQSPEYVARIARYLLSRPVAGFQPGAALRGPSWEDYRVRSMSTGARLAYRLVTSGALADRHLVTYEEVVAHLPGQWHNRAIVAGLEQAGCVTIGRTRVSSGGTIYATPLNKPDEIEIFLRMPEGDLLTAITRDRDDTSVT